MRLLAGIATIIILPIAAVAVAMSLMSSGGQASPLSGAIFTTTANGAIVNENVRYNSKVEVYLDGGPGPNAPQPAAGLPDGDYYFQVTDPSGAVLLSEDPAECREIRVSDGVIVALLSIGRTYGSKTTPCSIQDAPTPPYDPDVLQGVPGPSGRHDTNVDLDHGMPAIVVQLMPFFDTPNNGGVYKAWIIPTSRYVANGGDPDAIPSPKRVKGKQVGYERDPGFGPPRDQVKTDNFKVKGKVTPPEVTVRKFDDLNGNGIWDAGELEIGVDECVKPDGDVAPCDPGGGWPYSWTSPLDGGTMMEHPFFTPHTHVAALPGEYTACEDDLWVQTALYIDGVKVATDSCGAVMVDGTSGEKHTIVFGNTRPGKISGEKFIDYDADGSRDAEDVCPSAAQDSVNHPGCAGVTIHLDGTDNLGDPVHRTDETDQHGRYEFDDVMPGEYVVTIVTVEEPPGFFCSIPGVGAECHYDVSGPTGGDDVEDIGFGDFSKGEILGLKYHDLDGDGEKDAGESGLPDWEINLDGTANVDLGSGTDVHLVTWTCGGVNVPDCEGLPAGSYWFMNLIPGDYEVSEVMSVDGWAQTAPTPVPPGTWSLALTSDQTCEHKDFGNFGPCAGLTPGYWSNWRNHYSEAQFLILLDGTVAEGDIALADEDLTSLGCDDADALHCMVRFLLSDQLTLNLTQHPELPNSSGGALVGTCSILSIGTLQSAIDDALDILSDPGAYSRDDILSVKNALAAFAELD
jgi:SdrD B-like domain